MDDVQQNMEKALQTTNKNKFLKAIVGAKRKVGLDRLVLYASERGILEFDMCIPIQLRFLTPVFLVERVKM
jgi:hypothetical protein